MSDFWPETTDALLHTTQSRRQPSKWEAYRGPTEAILRQYGLPPADREDVLAEAMVRLYNAAKRYDPSLGRFHSYFRSIVVNLKNDYYREKGKREVLLRDYREIVPRNHDEPAAAGGFEQIGEADMELLVARGLELFEEFVASTPARLEARRNAETLLYAIQGEKQKTIAARLQLTTRQVRNLVRGAVQDFHDWSRQRFHPDDFAILQQANLSYPSAKKRRTVLALLGKLWERADQGGEEQSAELGNPG